MARFPWDLKSLQNETFVTEFNFNDVTVENDIVEEYFNLLDSGRIEKNVTL